MKQISIILMAGILMASCIQVTINGNDDKDNGPAVKSTYALNEEYHKLDVSQSFDVTMSDTATMATVIIDSAFQDRLIFRVENGTLKIGLKPGIYRNIDDARVILPYNPSLSDIDLSGASYFATGKALVAEDISIELSGASHCSADIETSLYVDIEASGASHFSGSIQQVANGNIDVDLSGASNALISGTTTLLDIDISGASHLDAANLDATAVTGDIGGASTAKVLCCESIKVDVSGASHLTYGKVADGCVPAVKCGASGASTVKAM